MFWLDKYGINWFRLNLIMFFVLVEVKILFLGVIVNLMKVDENVCILFLLKWILG